MMQCLVTFALVAGFVLAIVVALIYRRGVMSCRSLVAKPEPLPEMDHRDHLYIKL